MTLLPGYHVKQLSRIYQTPHLPFSQEGVPMSAHAFDYRGKDVRKSDVCVLWVSFQEQDGTWSEPELIICAEDGGDVLVAPFWDTKNGNPHSYYRVYPEEVHPSVLSVIQTESSVAA